MKLFYAKNETMQSLLKKFNNRDSVAFGEIYSILYKELYYFTFSLYKETTVDPKDIIQDVFAEIWDDRKNTFHTVTGLRSYIYVVIKTKFLKHYRHEKVAKKFDEAMINDMSMGYAIEGEVYSIIPEALGMLPVECAKSFKLFLEGYDVKEIAEMLGKQPSTIYNQRKEAISILKRRLSDYKFTLLLLIIT